MTVGTTIDFSMTGAEVVEEALAELGVLAAEESLSAWEQTRGLKRLNMLLKSWQADGVYPWTLTEDSFTLVQGTASYLFGTGGTKTYVPFDLGEPDAAVRITRSSVDRPLREIGRRDYFALPNKTTQGNPTQYYYDRQRESGTLYLWPTADAGLGTLKYTYRRSLFDIDAATETLDLPQEWGRAVVKNLADDMAVIYGKAGSPRAQKIALDAKMAKDSVADYAFAQGASSVTIMPDMD